MLILGAGGVARAVAMMLLDKGAKEAIILNRTVEKAQSIADEVNHLTGKNRKFAKALSIDAYDTLPEGERYLAIQATSVGMYPDCDAAVIEDPTFYKRVHTGYDLIFNPPKTRLWNWWRHRAVKPIMVRRCFSIRESLLLNCGQAARWNPGLQTKSMNGCRKQKRQRTENKK